MPFTAFPIPTVTFDSVFYLSVKEFGAVGDGATDDTTAFTSWINALIAGSPGPLMGFIPAGNYIISSSLPTATVPIAIRGAGQFQSIIRPGAGLSGDVFSFSECWVKNRFGSTGVTLPPSAGIFLSDFSIFGTIGANTQHAFTFYDRNDFVHMSNIGVFVLNGRALNFGVQTKNTIQAYLRESHFRDLRFWFCGTSTLPVIEIGTIGNGDRSNTCYWSGIDIFAPAGDGLALRSTATNGLAVDQQYFDYLRIEYNSSPAATVGTAIKLGDSGYTGRVTSNKFSKVFLLPASGQFGISLFNNGNVNLNYENEFTSSFIGGNIGSNGKGINIVGGRDFYYQGRLDSFAGGNPGVTVGPTSGGSGGNLIFDLFKNDSVASSIDASATGNVFHYSLASGL